MKPVENTRHAMSIKDFLSVSREYFALSSNARETKQQSSVTAKQPSTPASTYRKVVQSFLLAAGVGAFAAAPAMADSGCGYMGGNAERHAKMMEQHHTRLHDALKLTPEQEPAWKKLIESEQPRPALSGGQPEDWAKLNAPERAEKMLELSKARQVQLAEHVAALKAFYAVLTSEQQKTFEDFHAGPRGAMAGKRGAKAAGADKAQN